jgi:hypothetical protein
MPEKDEVDRLLDSALSTYGDPGEDSGLERRVLAALSAGRERRAGRGLYGKARGWLAWAIAAPLAASLLLWMGVQRARHVAPVETQQASGREQPQGPSGKADAAGQGSAVGKHSPGAEARAGLGRRAGRARPCGSRAAGACGGGESGIAKNAALPKLDVFPTPQPLTPQESALAVVAKQAPIPLRKALIEAQMQEDAPVRIAAIHIPPIELQSQTQP